MNEEEKSTTDSISLREVRLNSCSFNLQRGKLGKDLRLEVSLSIDLQTENLPEFSVFLTVQAKLVNDANESAIDLLVRNEGLFELHGEKSEFFRSFCYINAPALIYPYIRETVFSLPGKAGIQPINLPPFNFVAFGKEKMDSESIESKLMG